MGDSSPMTFGKGFKRDEIVYNICVLMVMDLNCQYESSAFPLLSYIEGIPIMGRYPYVYLIIF